VVTIREYDQEAELLMISAERPYSRMLLPYYLGRGMSESRIFTASPARLAQLNVQARVGRRAVQLDADARKLTLDDGTELEYDELFIATGSSPVRPPVPGAEGSGVHSFWTLEQARAVLAEFREGGHVVIVGGGFIGLTMVNAILAHKARLTIIEVAGQILPKMIDAEGAWLAESWLQRHGVEVRTGATVTAIEDVQGKKRLRLHNGENLVGDMIIMATGIRPNIDWLKGSGIALNRGIVVNQHLRSSLPHVYAGGDVAEGRDAVTQASSVHAIEPTAMEHGRIAGANMTGESLTYPGSLLMNIVEVCGLDVASFGAWDDVTAEATSATRRDTWAHRKLLWRDDRLIGAIIVGRANDIWATNDIGMLKGLIQMGQALGGWKEHLRRNPFSLKPAFVSSGAVGRLLPKMLLGRPPTRAGVS
jgi:NAD(P)H-nitrite reductase large subunit